MSDKSVQTSMSLLWPGSNRTKCQLMDLRVQNLNVVINAELNETRSKNDL